MLSGCKNEQALFHGLCWSRVLMWLMSPLFSVSLLCCLVLHHTSLLQVRFGYCVSGKCCLPILFYLCRSTFWERERLSFFNDCSSSYSLRYFPIFLGPPWHPTVLYGSHLSAKRSTFVWQDYGLDYGCRIIYHCLLWLFGLPCQSWDSLGLGRAAYIYIASGRRCWALFWRARVVSLVWTVPFRFAMAKKLFPWGCWRRVAGGFIMTKNAK